MLAIAANWEIITPTCAQTGEFCDGMEGVAEIMLVAGFMGSVVIALLGWGIWRQKAVAWILCTTYFAFAALWTIDTVWKSRHELEFHWVGVPLVMNVVILVCLVLPPVVRWCWLVRRRFDGTG